MIGLAACSGTEIERRVVVGSGETTSVSVSEAGVRVVFSLDEPMRVSANTYPGADALRLALGRDGEEPFEWVRIPADKPARVPLPAGTFVLEVPPDAMTGELELSGYPLETAPCDPSAVDFTCEPGAYPGSGLLRACRVEPSGLALEVSEFCPRGCGIGEDTCLPIPAPEIEPNNRAGQAHDLGELTASKSLEWELGMAPLDSEDWFAFSLSESAALEAQLLAPISVWWENPDRPEASRCYTPAADVEVWDGDEMVLARSMKVELDRAAAPLAITLEAGRYHLRVRPQMGQAVDSSCAIRMKLNAAEPDPSVCFPGTPSVCEDGVVTRCVDATVQQFFCPTACSPSGDVCEPAPPFDGVLGEGDLLVREQGERVQFTLLEDSVVRLRHAPATMGEAPRRIVDGVVSPETDYWWGCSINEMGACRVTDGRPVAPGEETHILGAGDYDLTDGNNQAAGWVTLQASPLEECYLGVFEPSCADGVLTQCVQPDADQHRYAAGFSNRHVSGYVHEQVCAIGCASSGLYCEMNTADPVGDFGEVVAGDTIAQGTLLEHMDVHVTSFRVDSPLLARFVPQAHDYPLDFQSSIIPEDGRLPYYHAVAHKGASRWLSLREGDYYLSTRLRNDDTRDVPGPHRGVVALEFFEPTGAICSPDAFESSCRNGRERVCLERSGRGDWVFEQPCEGGSTCDLDGQACLPSLTPVGEETFVRYGSDYVYEVLFPGDVFRYSVRHGGGNQEVPPYRYLSVYAEQAGTLEFVVEYEEAITRLGTGVQPVDIAIGILDTSGVIRAYRDAVGPNGRERITMNVEGGTGFQLFFAPSRPDLDTSVKAWVALR